MASPHVGIELSNLDCSIMVLYISEILLLVGITLSISLNESGFGECI